MNGWSRAVATLLGAGIAGFLLWVAAQVNDGSTGGYWAAYGIVAGAGVVLALSQLRGGGGNPRAMLTLAFLPVLVAAGWVLLAMQPNPNWFRNHVLAWSGDIGIRQVVLDVGTWIGVLAFGIGYAFGVMLEPFGRRRRAVVPAVDPEASDAPTTAERAEIGDGATTTSEPEPTPTAR
jgi:hypothetical protein